MGLLMLLKICTHVTNPRIPTHIINYRCEFEVTSPLKIIQLRTVAHARFSNVVPGRFVHPVEAFTPNTIVNVIFQIMIFRPVRGFLSL
jgi:hypothetical protein